MKSKNWKYLLGLAATFSVPFVASASLNLVADGGFENPSAVQPFQTFNISGTVGAWTVASGSVDLIGNYWRAAEGSQSLDLSGYQNGTISQSLSLSPGTYKLTFAESGNPDGPPDLKHLLVTLGGSTQTFDYNYVNQGTTRGNMQWLTQTAYFSVTATSGSTLVFQDGSVLANSGYGPPGTTPWGVALDDVQLTAVPEPTTLIAGALLLLPFGASTLRILRRGRMG